MAAEEDDVEARIARLESDVAHIRSDMAEVKSDIRTLRDRIDAVELRLSAKIDALKDELHSAKVWALLLYFALAGGMYATMARGFGWI
jgi:outer membrane murein-binding lipoprotein Lpp